MSRVLAPRPIRAAKIPEDLVEVFGEETHPQGSEEWFNARLAMCTASKFKIIMAHGRDGEESKTRARLLNRMVAEHFTRKPANTYENEQMKRGRAMEAAALEHYAFTRNAEVQRVGFVRRTIKRGILPDLVVGCSPDGLVREDRVVQVKTMEPELIIDLVRTGKFPSEHKAQCQGELWVTGRSLCDLKIYYEGCPVGRTFTLSRDDAYIAEIRAAVECFDYELRQAIEDVKKKGLQ